MRRHSFAPRDDAMRMTLGNPSFPGAYVVDNGFQYLLDVGIEQIEAHVLELTARLREGLLELGLEVLTPAEPSRRAGQRLHRPRGRPPLRRAAGRARRAGLGGRRPGALLGAPLQRQHGRGPRHRSVAPRR